MSVSIRDVFLDRRNALSSSNVDLNTTKEVPQASEKNPLHVHCALVKNILRKIEKSKWGEEGFNNEIVSLKDQLRELKALLIENQDFLNDGSFWKENRHVFSELGSFNYRLSVTQWASFINLGISKETLLELNHHLVSILGIVNGKGGQIEATLKHLMQKLFDSQVSLPKNSYSSFQSAEEAVEKMYSCKEAHFIREDILRFGDLFVCPEAVSKFLYSIKGSQTLIEVLKLKDNSYVCIGSFDSDGFQEKDSCERSVSKDGFAIYHKEFVHEARSVMSWIYPEPGFLPCAWNNLQNFLFVASGQKFSIPELVAHTLRTCPSAKLGQLLREWMFQSGKATPQCCEILLPEQKELPYFNFQESISALKEALPLDITLETPGSGAMGAYVLLEIQPLQELSGFYECLVIDPHDFNWQAQSYGAFQKILLFKGEKNEIGAFISTSNGTIAYRVLRDNLLSYSKGALLKLSEELVLNRKVEVPHLKGLRKYTEKLVQDWLQIEMKASSQNWKALCQFLGYYHTQLLKWLTSDPIALENYKKMMRENILQRLSAIEEEMNELNTRKVLSLQDLQKLFALYGLISPESPMPCKEKMVRLCNDDIKETWRSKSTEESLGIALKDRLGNIESGLQVLLDKVV